MKCEIVIQNIDRYFFGELDELDVNTRQHLASCRDCNLHFINQKKAGDVVNRIADFEPILIDPTGLTDDIMDALPDSVTESETGKRTSHIAIFQHAFFRWSISAAAVVLFSLFAFEQYLVLDKINQLETQYQNVPEAKFSRKGMKTLNSWEIRTLRSFNHVKTNNMELFEKINSMANNI